MRDKRRAKNSAAKERRMSVSSVSKTKASNLLDGIQDGEEEDADVAMLNELSERFEAATALSPGACTKARSSTTAVMAQAQRLQTRWVYTSISFLSYYALVIRYMFTLNTPHLLYPQSYLFSPPSYPNTFHSTYPSSSCCHPSGLVPGCEANVLSQIYSNIYVHEVTMKMITPRGEYMD